jgi:hypothetical protein
MLLTIALESDFHRTGPKLQHQQQTNQLPLKNEAERQAETESDTKSPPAAVHKLWAARTKSQWEKPLSKIRYQRPAREGKRESFERRTENSMRGE